MKQNIMKRPMRESRCEPDVSPDVSRIGLFLVKVTSIWGNNYII